MQVTFLLGPAGSGKTRRCLEEIRLALQASPEGPPLLLLAPKQATFQLERQLLAYGSLAGYTRLQILSFERLAQWTFARLGRPLPELLSDEGRVMVLRALLERTHAQLQVFRASARLPGFARQLSLLLRELQRHRLSPARLETLAAETAEHQPLSAKLHDLARLLRDYHGWLRERHLHDADSLLDLATAALESTPPPGQWPAKAKDSVVTTPATAGAALSIAGLWIDGFAQMTPQECGLLVALLPSCQKATVAFCLEAEPAADTSWHSPWSLVTRTCLQCRDEFARLQPCQVQWEVLPRRSACGRFAGQPILRHLEESWAQPQAFAHFKPQNAVAASSPGAAPVLEVFSCADPEAETVAAAREVLRFVQAGGRFRDVAVLARQLDLYHDPLRRTFNRYGIPFFLDRREPVAHHPLAELTRSALRLAAFGWQHEDWFGALKTGLAGADDAEVDHLENAALARGWQGAAWQSALPVDGPDQKLELLRRRVVMPFNGLCGVLEGPCSGAQLAGSIRRFWDQLRVVSRLQRWSNAEMSRLSLPVSNSVHATVWEQMQDWLENLERAFSNLTLPAQEWLPILDSGLSGLTVGVIPPALDQVLIGAVDRSRNPDLQLAIVLGVNETVFPAPPAPANLLTETDRRELASHDAPLGPDARQQIGREDYYGYIACTRARQRLVLTCVLRDAAGRLLNPSAFIVRLKRLFPGLQEELFTTPVKWQEALHASELVGTLLRIRASANLSRPPISPAEPGAGEIPAAASVAGRSGAQPTGLGSLEALPVFAPVLSKWESLAARRRPPALSGEPCQRLYGPELLVSVSSLEDFAACPFKFFVRRGLRAEERDEFELGHREKGTFQHEILSRFHLRLAQDGKRWRDISPLQARALVAELGAEVLDQFRDGLFRASDQGRFSGQALIESLQTLVATLVEWMPQYGFDPTAVELGFGFPDSPLPGWRLDLAAGNALVLRGRIDRLDLHTIAETGETLGVIVDYKSAARTFNAAKLHFGLELQLLAYLNVLRFLAQASPELKAPHFIPAGVFYVNLRGSYGSEKVRSSVIDGHDAARRKAYQHTGRFDGSRAGYFDKLNRGDQFKFGGRSKDALTAGDFQQLLDRIKDQLSRFGDRIYAGEVAPAPYRINQETACHRCDLRAVCRFDPWIEPYRVLRLPPAAGPEPAPDPDLRVALEPLEL